MNVMHIDFFFHDRRQKQEEMKGFFRWRRKKRRSGVLLMQAIYFPLSKKRKSEWVGSSSGKSASLHAVIKLLSGLWTMFQLRVCATH